MLIASGYTGFRGSAAKTRNWPEATGICSVWRPEVWDGGWGGAVSRGSEAEVTQYPLQRHVSQQPGCSLPGSVTPARHSPHGGPAWVSVSCPNGLLKNHQSLAWATLIQRVLVLACLHLPRPRVHTTSGTGTGPWDPSTVGGGRLPTAVPSSASSTSTNFRFSAGEGAP